MFGEQQGQVRTLTGQREHGLNKLILSPHWQLMVGVIMGKQNIPDAKCAFFPQRAFVEGIGPAGSLPPSCPLVPLPENKWLAASGVCKALGSLC